MAQQRTRENETFEELVDIIGLELAREVCSRLGGSPIYVPREPQREERNMRIKQHYGRLLERMHPLNMRRVFAELETEFGLSEAQLRRIIRE